MTSRPFMLTALLALTTLVSTQCLSQNKSISDPSVSTHNYKHPNKAKQASKLSAGEAQINVPDGPKEAQKATSRPAGHQTPKYASRPSSLVVPTSRSKQKANINPLVSEYNYKTKTETPKQSPEEHLISGSL
jgi:hypothetical protein